MKVYLKLILLFTLYSESLLANQYLEIPIAGESNTFNSPQSITRNISDRLDEVPSFTQKSALATLMWIGFCKKENHLKPILLIFCRITI